MSDRKAHALVHGAIDQSALTLGAHAREILECGLAKAVTAGDLVVIKTDAGITLLTAEEARKRKEAA